MTTYRLVKEARADGWRDYKPDEYGGETIVVKGALLVRNPQRAMSRSEWGRLGYEVKPNQKPYATRYIQKGKFDYPVYRRDQVLLKNPRKLLKRNPRSEDEAAFIVALKASPRCRASWLVYADWLEEHDDETTAHEIRGYYQ